MKRYFIPIAIYLLFSIPLAHASIIETTEYPSIIKQKAGTEVTHSLKVMNDADFMLEKVYVKVLYLPSSWHESGNPIRLNPSEEGKISFTLKIPSDAIGEVPFGLRVEAIRGFGIVDSKTLDAVLITFPSSELGADSSGTTTSTTSTIVTTTEAKNITKTGCDVRDILSSILRQYWGILIGMVFSAVIIVAFAVIKFSDF